jgi:uncharacterized membrane protein YebE (DUF533 family)
MTIELRKAGWLGRLLSLYFEHHDPDVHAERMERARAGYEHLALEEQAEQVTRVRLARLQLQRGRALLPPRLAEALADLDEGDAAVLGMLTTQWDLLQEISLLYENKGDVVERQCELLTITALGLKRFKLARKLHAAHLKAAAGKKVGLAKLALKVEKHLAPKGALPVAHQALRVGIGLAYLEARALARIATDYYARAVIEEEGVARLHSLSRGDKVELVEVLLALAWADGEVTSEERGLIEQQIGLADLPVAEARRLLGHLEAPVPPLELSPIDPASRRFVLEQAVLISLVDDVQTPAERVLLREVCTNLGGDAAELDEVLIEVMSFYAQHRDNLHSFGIVSGQRLNELRSSVTARAQQAVKLNLSRLLQEVRETGELAKLLTAASVRELSAEESEKVKTQLVDVIKTVPALAIFVLPGGGFLLPVLMKALPFNILPTAFSEEAPRSGSDRLRAGP